MRIDGEGDNGYFIEAGQVLWGNPREAGDNWTLLKESRGTEIYLPYKLKKPDSKWVKIKTRNYIDYNEIGQAGYVDCRFVDFDEGGQIVEKAKLINIRRSKKGKLIGDIQFEDGKMMQIPHGTKLDESLNNTECIVDRPNGIIKSITVNKKEIFTEAGSTMSSGMDKKQKYNKTKNTFKKATAKLQRLTRHITLYL